MAKQRTKTEKMKWYVLEMSALDDRIELYEWETEKTDRGEIWEEVSDALRQYSSIILIDDEQLDVLTRSIAILKGGEKEDE